MSTEKDTEPKIVDEPEVPKKTLPTLRYKIDPVVAYFPECSKADTKALTRIRNLYSSFKFSEANQAIDDLKLSADV